MYAQLVIEWDKTFAGDRHDIGQVIVQTSDGGYLMGGTSASGVSGEKTQPLRGSNINAGDYWIIKMSANGTKQWDKTIGGDGVDYLNAILQTSDGGFLLGGNSRSDISGEKTANHFGNASSENHKTDFWIVKLAADGTKQWDRTIGGDLEEALNSIIPTSDGGYMLGGSSFSATGGDKTQNSKGEADYWIVKINSSGNILWDKTIGGNQSDFLKSIIQTSDGGYVLAGTSSSAASGDKSVASKGGTDYWIVKLAADGSVQWDKTLGGSDSDDLATLKPTNDGGYIVGGTSVSGISGDKTEVSRGIEDYWILKLSQTGTEQWQKTLGGPSTDRLCALEQLSDEGYLLSGSSISWVAGDNTVGNFGGSDCWLVKLSSDGTKQWDTIAGSYYYDELQSLHKTNDGGVILAGYSNSEANFYKTEGIRFATFENDYWIVKMVPQSGNKQLSFSKQSLTFTNTPNNTILAETVVLSSGTGTSPITMGKPALSSWINLPSPALGSMSFTVNEPVNIAAVKSVAVVTASSPGYGRAAMIVNLISPQIHINYIPDQTSFIDTLLTFNVNTETVPAEYTEPTRVFSLVNAPSGASIGSSTGIFSWTPTVAGVYTFTIKAAPANSSGFPGEKQIKITVIDPNVHEEIRIDAGGHGILASGNRVFLADRYFGGVNRTTSGVQGNILGTSDDEIYRTGRCTPAFSYDIPMKNGTYEVVLHFVETWFGTPGRGPGGIGSRVFHVDIEGSRKLTNYDIFSKAEGAMRAIQEKFLIIVNDGTLNINFISGPADMPRVAAIEVHPPKTLLSLAPIADAYVRAGVYAVDNFGNASTLEVKNGIDPRIDRASHLKFSLNGITTLKSAKLQIYGNNFEDNRSIRVVAEGISDDSWAEGGITWYSAPQYGWTQSMTEINGRAKYYEFDVTEFVNHELAGDKTATILLINKDLQNRRLIFNSKENASNPPQLLIETMDPVSPIGARMGSEIPETSFESVLEQSSIFPNPVNKQFTVTISDRHRGEVFLEMLNITGNAYQITPKEKIHAGSKIEVNIGHFSLGTGIHLLRLKSSALSETVKVMIVN